MANAAPGAVGLVRQAAPVGAVTVSWLERPGTDPPVLCLPGWGSDATTMATLLRASRTRRRLVALDLPGFGASPLGPGGWTRAAYAELVATLIRERGWARPSLFGHSYGGGVAVRVGAGPSPPVDRLVLCSPSGLRLAPDPETERRRRRYHRWRRRVAWLPPPLREAALCRLRARFGSADYRDAGPMRETMVHAVNEDLGEVAAQVRLQTLLLWGAHDAALPLETVGRRYERLIPEAVLIPFAASGHFPFLDEPVRFARVFDAFVDAAL